MCLDANQLVSSLLSTRGLQAQMIDAWRRRAFVLLLGPRQANQAAGVLRRPKIAKKYRITPADRRAFVDLFQAEGVLLPDAPGPASAVTRTTMRSWDAPWPAASSTSSPGTTIS